MVRQIVLVRWVEGTSEAAKKAVAGALLGLADAIEEIRDIRVGFDLGIRDGNFDFAVSVDFDDEAGYLRYRDHPAHQQVVADRIRPVMAERAGIVFKAL